MLVHQPQQGLVVQPRITRSPLCHASSTKFIGSAPLLFLVELGIRELAAIMYLGARVRAARDFSYPTNPARFNLRWFSVLKTLH